MGSSAEARGYRVRERVRKMVPTLQSRRANGSEQAMPEENSQEAPFPKRDQILEAAEQAFADRGLDGATLRQIAASVGLGNAGLIYYFASKETLYRAVLGDIGNDLERSIAAALARDLDPLTRLRAYVDAQIDWIDRRPTGARLVQRELLDNEKRIASANALPLQGYVETGRRLVDEAKAAGVIRPLPTEVILTMIVGTMLHAAEIRPTYARLFKTPLLSNTRPWVNTNVDALFDMLANV